MIEVDVGHGETGEVGVGPEQVELETMPLEFNPAGSPETDQVLPRPSRDALYEVPTVPFGREVVVMVGAPPTRLRGPQLS